jgi:hypothetical protein
MKSKREDKSFELRYEELVLRGKLIHATLPYRIPRVAAPFPVTKVLSLSELFSEHADKLPAPLVNAWTKLEKIRKSLEKCGASYGQATDGTRN